MVLIFTGGPMVENPRSNAAKVDLIPCKGTKVPHAPGGTMKILHAATKPGCSQKIN